MAVAGAHGVAVDALGRDALAAAALDRVVEAQYNHPCRHEYADQQSQEQTRCSPGAPDSTVEHAVIVDEAALPAQPRDAQQARHGALAGCQDGAHQQHFSMPPRSLLHEHRREGQDDRGEAGRQAGHGDVSWRRPTTLAGRPLRHPRPARNGQSPAEKSHQIIAGLKTRDWYRQNAALAKLDAASASKMAKDNLFVIGRNIYQAACGSVNAVVAFITNFFNATRGYHAAKRKAILDGMLFEVFFNPQGKLRDKIKTGCFNELFEIQRHPQFKGSFEFIAEALTAVRA
jgi:hypothetical protein